jgi:outer membrane protein
VEPSYPGADGISLLPLIDIDRARGETPFEFEAPDEGFGLTLFRAGSLAVGPVVSLVGARKPETVGAELPKVERTVEVGGFAHVWFGEHFRLHGEMRGGVNGHDGWVGVGGVDLVVRSRDTWLVSVGPRLTWADNAFHDAYFTVAPTSAATTGLPVYDAGSGFASAGITAGVELQITPRWGLASYARYDRLIGDAANSPIVQQLGSRDQASAGVALSYTFGGVK